MAVQSSSANVAVQKDIAAKPKSATPSTLSPVLPPEDLYEKYTMVVMLQFRPEQEPGASRSILLSVQNGITNKDDLPLYRVLSEEALGGPLPPAVVSLIDALQQQLPERKARHEQRTAKKASPAQQKEASSVEQKKKIKKTLPPRSQRSAQAPVFAGMFEDL